MYKHKFLQALLALSKIYPGKFFLIVLCVFLRNSFANEMCNISVAKQCSFTELTNDPGLEKLKERLATAFAIWTNRISNLDQYNKNMILMFPSNINSLSILSDFSPKSLMQRRVEYDLSYRSILEKRDMFKRCVWKS
ncbi:MAG: hypothetical protein QE271_04030 [Bacteriovoracaceae bacterium]|nr:hypothetical protein [Bacteriovoracaceae bacterium]